MSSDITAPNDYPKRILMTICGLTPQVVTETVYALAVQQNPKFVPTEVRLITTQKGAELAIKYLLEGEKWFYKLCQEYQIPEINFSTTTIYTLNDLTGKELGDIRTVDDNENAANQITDQIRTLTNDSDSALHVSIAGGRKTMGYFTGYALSLFGRPQDRLSHVLVSPPFESQPEFFYPTKNRCIIHSNPGNTPLDVSEAEVTLASIPFVRLREELPQSSLDDKARFSETVSTAQSAITSPELFIDLPGKKIQAAGRVIHLPPLQISFLGWICRRRQDSKNWITCPNEGAPEKEYAEEFLEVYRISIGEMGSEDRTAKRLEQGMTRDFFSQTKSKLSRLLSDRLGRIAADPYLIKKDYTNRQYTYGLNIKPASIQFKTIEAE